MRHRLHASTDRLKAIEYQQIQGRCQQAGHYAGAIAFVAMGLFMELRVTNPVPALNAPALSHQL